MTGTLPMASNPIARTFTPRSQNVSPSTTQFFRALP